MKLKNDELTVEFKPEGATISSIKDRDGVEYLWQGNPEYWGGQAPVLFPICGSLRNDGATFQVGEKTISGSMPRHGIVRKRTFDLVKHTENEIQFRILSDDEMLKQYPFPFELKLTYRLDGKRLETEYAIRYLGELDAMPFFIGGHPGFNCPLLEDEAFDDYYLEFELEEDCTIPESFPETGLPDFSKRQPMLSKTRILDLNYELFQHDALTFDNLKSRKVALKTKNHQKGLKVSFEDFPFLVVWTTTNKGPFIALEPWSGLSTSLTETDNFIDKTHVTYVEKGEVSRKAFTIEIR